MDFTFLDRATFDTESLTPDFAYRAIFAGIQDALVNRRGFLYSRYSPASMTSYLIARLLGDYAIMLQFDWIEILPSVASHEFGEGVKRSSQTERYACFLWRNGWIPGNAYTQDKYWIMPKYKRLEKLDKSWVEDEPHKHNDAMGFICVECEQRKPASDFRLDDRRKTGRSPYCSKCEVKPFKLKKVCPECGNGYLADRQHFHPDASRPDGLMRWCIWCFNAYNKRNMRRSRKVA